jgi:hypothetical protein
MLYYGIDYFLKTSHTACHIHIHKNFGDCFYITQCTGFLYDLFPFSFKNYTFFIEEVLVKYCENWRIYDYFRSWSYIKIIWLRNPDCRRLLRSSVARSCIMVELEPELQRNAALVPTPAPKFVYNISRLLKMSQTVTVSTFPIHTCNHSNQNKFRQFSLKL